MINKSLLTSSIRLLSFALLILILPYQGLAQQKSATKEISVLQDFKLRQVYHYTFEKGQIDSAKAKGYKFKVLTDITLRVIQKGDTSAVYGWKYGESKITGLTKEQADEIDIFTKGALQICKGLEIRLQIDKSGQISGISNFERCQKFIDSAYLVISGLAPADQKIDKDAIIEMVKPSIATWDVFIATYCQEINQFFFISGVALESNQEYNFPTEIPNPFGGPNFPATSIIKLDNVKDNIANISMNTTVKPKDMDLVMKETFKIIEKQGGEPFDTKDMPKMKMVYKDYYKYDIKATLMREMYEEKLMVVGPKKKTTTIRIKLLDK